MDVLFVVLGLAALVVGGDQLVTGSVALAQRFRVPPMIIGLTLVGFGTSAPELFTSLQAARTGAPAIALGNVVGSNIANILLILGIAALLRPIPVDRARLWRDGIWLGGSAALLAVLLIPTEIGRLSGGVLLGGLAAFLILTLRSGSSALSTEFEAPRDSALIAALRFGGGLALTIVGAVLLVDGATGIARSFGVSEAVIGLTLVAVGTSLPELVTSVLAARRGETEVALGNVIGSNIFNVLGILGTTALVAPLPVDPEIAQFDIWVMLAATILLMLVATTGRIIARWEGALLLATYAAYLVALS